MTEGDDRRGKFPATSELQPFQGDCKPRLDVSLGTGTRLVGQAMRRDGAQKIKS